MAACEIIWPMLPSYPPSGEFASTGLGEAAVACFSAASRSSTRLRASM